MTDEVRVLKRERDQYRYAYEHLKQQLEELEARHKTLLAAFNALSAGIHDDLARLVEAGT